MATLRLFRKFRFGAVVLFTLIGCVAVGGFASAHGAMAEPGQTAANLRTDVDCSQSLLGQLLSPFLSNCSDQQLKALVKVTVPDGIEVVVEEDGSVEVYRANDINCRAFRIDRWGSAGPEFSAAIVSLGIISAPLLV
jgi:hypothetical protein